MTQQPETHDAVVDMFPSTRFDADDWLRIFDRCPRVFDRLLLDIIDAGAPMPTEASS